MPKPSKLFLSKSGILVKNSGGKPSKTQNIFCDHLGSNGINHIQKPTMFKRSQSQNTIMSSLKGKLVSCSLKGLQLFLISLSVSIYLKSRYPVYMSPIKLPGLKPRDWTHSYSSWILRQALCCNSLKLGHVSFDFDLAHQFKPQVKTYFFLLL